MMVGCEVLQDERFVSLKIGIDIYKVMAGKRSPYGPQKLKKVYKKMTGVEGGSYVNHMISGGYLYIVPGTGQGIEEDCRIMSSVLKQ
ncbi:hypothetical protein Cpap_0444 [Ruminiclostridium papyrosolvens DSM 2782]|uniref:Uncharacterized protein n=1 Tax=Ruminiclostridium papyrosolvens DSM 2782 TaxID=588581 RepID=F1THE7_9FIRM|nr:hypothetical protein [Ruminiclostridium papyrosolvens]EGD46150.1 hypothetical protein Cpap_0444 [Ruminiclostridium papyrosolvens DSM 2782]WES35935.1 hypothetical protein P0092_08220 [Ruminiclostridium papyrosolvens DSM 2782]